MLSFPDFKSKQLIFINVERESAARLKYDNDNIVFIKNSQVIHRVSIHRIFALFICGDIFLSTYVIKKAREHGVSIFLMRSNLQTYGGVYTAAEGNYLLRMRQYSFNTAGCLYASQRVVRSKIINQFRLSEKRSDRGGILKLREQKRALLDLVKSVEDTENLLGIEGRASRLFFRNYFNKIHWRRRAPRTKEDIPNFLLDMGYTFLFNFVDSLLRLYGFDTYKGFYHKLFFQRRSLSCDIMEPFRCIVDRQLLTSYNLKQVKEEDFKYVNGGYTLPFSNRDKYVKIFLECIMDYREEIYRYVNEFYRFMMDDEKNPFPEFVIK